MHRKPDNCGIDNNVDMFKDFDKSKAFGAFLDPSLYEFTALASLICKHLEYFFPLTRFPLIGAGNRQPTLHLTLPSSNPRFLLFSMTIASITFQ